MQGQQTGSRDNRPQRDCKSNPMTDFQTTMERELNRFFNHMGTGGFWLSESLRLCKAFTTMQRSQHTQRLSMRRTCGRTCGRKDDTESSTRAQQRLLSLGTALILMGAASQGAATAQPGTGQKATTLPPQIARDQWKDCEFNLQVIGCSDEQLVDGLRITWKDGIRTEYRIAKPPEAGNKAILKDRLGGLWSREVLVQGNVILTHLGNGNRIMIPLRLTCRQPLKGYLGYCSD